MRFETYKLIRFFGNFRTENSIVVQFPLALILIYRVKWQETGITSKTNMHMSHSYFL
jgi:hypothetical protein